MIDRVKENFNPRSHERSDEELTALMNTVNISIHAPTRGATDSRLDNVEEYQYISIHAPTRGCLLYTSPSPRDS